MKILQSIAIVFMLTTNLFANIPSTIATGDTRTLPAIVIFPPVCAVVKATKFIVATTTLNLDPFAPGASPFGVLGATGGTSLEPSSSSSSYVAAETLDNTVVQGALNSCAAGKAVEFIPGDHGEMGFVLAPWSLPTHVSAIVDPGITVYASRNLSDYPGGNCGIVTPSSSSCKHWLTSPNSSGSGIYGYGILDGRGWDKYIGRSDGFYYNRIQAYCNAHNGPINGSPDCTDLGTGNNSYGPNGIDLVNVTNFTIYGITMKDAGNFQMNVWGNGILIDDVKVIAPFEVSNTDGIDPRNARNVTIRNSFVSVGDNHFAIKATSVQSCNISILNVQTGAGIGIAIGTDINSVGICNVLVSDTVQNGNLFNPQSAGIQIGSSSANGGLVDIVTFRRGCMVNEKQSMRFYTNYGGDSGSSIPIYTNIGVFDYHILASTAPYTTGKSGTYTFQGLAGHSMQIKLSGIDIDGSNEGIASQSGVTKNQNANVYLGPKNVPTSILNQIAAGTNMTTSGTPASSTPYPCSKSQWKPIIGELSVKTPTDNQARGFNNPTNLPYTLRAVVEPATEINARESAALTAHVQLIDNGVQISDVPLSGNGTLASFSIPTPPPGTHVYQTRYAGDSNYPAVTFGSVTVNNGGTPPPPPSGVTMRLAGSVN